MNRSQQKLNVALDAVLGPKIHKTHFDRGETTIEVVSEDYLEVCKKLHSDESLGFEQLIDLCGVDYAGWGLASAQTHESNSQRFAVVLHLLSIKNNARVRVRVSCNDADPPTVQSVTSIWRSAQWFEREAFDLFGIMFFGHDDLRRILTDYGFIGHPMRKDFPLSGHVEMRYDPVAARVIYQPVTIAPREITPRVVREPGYGGAKNG